MLFSEIIENVVEESINCRFGMLKVGFLPEQITRAELSEIRQGNEDEQREATCKLLDKGIKYWNVQLSESEEMPPDYETFSRKDFPESVLIVLIERLNKLVVSASGKQKTQAK